MPRSEELKGLYSSVKQGLDREHQKLLLRLADAEIAYCEDAALESFVAGWCLAAGIAEELKDHRYSFEQENEEKRKAGDCYHDYNLVFAMPDGRPVEERLIAKAMKDLCVENDLPVVVFHSLRHLSTSMKLQYSGGDIKAVQGDTGHSQARMVMNVYGHTFDANRKHVAELMEKSFFASGDKTPTEDKKMEQVLSLLKEKPELADLLLMLAEKTG